MKEKRLELKNSINRLQTGLTRLIEANASVDEMKKELIALEPELCNYFFRNYNFDLYLLI
jgi:hypothetical protein